VTTARERVDAIADRFDEQDASLAVGNPLGFPGYPEQIALARAETGLAEACIWGWAEIEDVRCALVFMDFAFLGGSMGIAVGEKVARAFDAARRAHTPVVTVTASGGARMQEGMLALAQMAKGAEARARHARAGLGHVTLLRSPTTGGVYASFASLADVIVAEEGATLGFSGPRVIQELTGVAPDPKIHTADYAFEHGLIDAIVKPNDEKQTIAKALRGLVPTPGGSGGSQARSAERPPSQKAWTSLTLSRRPDRPKCPEILDTLLDDQTELRGDRAGSDDPSVRIRLGALGDQRILAIGQDPTQGRIKPSGFRKAVRAIELAGRIGLPVVTLIDTPGADPLEEGAGVASAIARTFEALLSCPAPTLAVLVGEGGSGGALAMAVCDRVIAWENAMFSVIAPEGAAAILYRDPGQAPELAERLKITSNDLLDLGLLDAVVPEPSGGAQADPGHAVVGLAEAIRESLANLVGVRTRSRLRRRYRRWREAGNRYIQRAGS